jgi:CheY-like chemotaxis protein
MKTILLAEDEANLRMLVRTALNDLAYRILQAADGATSPPLITPEPATS